jgi:ubiquinone/menaquinone biosynthesis C-methylase UbiE
MMNKFPKETSLRIELKKAMKRLASLGVTYSSGYLEQLLEKYSSGVTYPRILMRIGEPNIRNHPLYKEILLRRGVFLDYGCGTGDDIRALLKDGYPKKNIKGFDIEWNSLNIGFDLYRDKANMQGVVFVSTILPFSKESFDVVYSGSVLHTIRQKPEIASYLQKVNEVLKNKGILFGSTLGTDNNSPISGEDLSLTLLTEKVLCQLLKEAGFTDLKTSITNIDMHKNPKYRIWFSGEK